MSESNPELFDLKHYKEFSDEGPTGGPTPAPAVDVEGRCGDCWGQVAGNKDAEGRWTRLECRVCGLAYDGDQAHGEVRLMIVEYKNNLPRARLGQPSRYRNDGRFFLKILPDMVRDVAMIDARMAAKRKEGRKGGYFTRTEFRNGDAGNFYFQACALMGGLGQLPQDFDLIPPLNDVRKRLHLREIAEDEEGGRRRLLVEGEVELSEPELVRNAGATLLTTMAAGFACEVGLKAILMTRVDEFEKTHDLKELYDALPADCRERLEADFPRIAEVLSERREAFDKWRYFHPNENSEPINNLIDSDGARDLAKAARVLIDEGLIAGLNHKVRVGPEIRYEIDEGGRERRFGKAEITGSESSIDWDVSLG